MGDPGRTALVGMPTSNEDEDEDDEGRRFLVRLLWMKEH